MKKIQKQIIVMISLVGLFTLQVAMIGKNHYPSSLKQSALHEFEGFYRFPNRAAYIQFEVIDEQLEARQVWDGRRYALIRTGDLTFESSQERYKLAFDAIPSNSVKILDRVNLIKVNFDPTKRKPLSSSVAQVYTGRYRLQHTPDYFIEVITEGGQLVIVQEWDGKHIPLEGITDQEFINQEAAMPVTFEAKESHAVHMRCFENDIWIKVSR